jgi:membrane-associated protease RseP (regulator of RpoE activity)
VEDTKTEPLRPARWLIPLGLLLATLGTTLWVGGVEWNAGALRAVKDPGVLDIIGAGVPYAFPLLGILIFHEMGHFIAGKIHKLQVSPPYFIPIPIALGTIGAFIVYRSKVRSARKLMDIAVAGPLSGIVIATVLMIVGLNLSTVGKLTPGMGTILQEGQSLYYMLLKLIVFGRLPPGYDVFLHPIAWAAWIGLFVTMINLLPVGQLDGGHVAYALVGARQNTISAFVHVGMVLFAIGLGLHYGARALIEGGGFEQIIAGVLTGSFWLAWALVLYILKRIGRGYHPPISEDSMLDPRRRVIGIATLVLFVFLFMPVPIRVVIL